MIKFVPEDTQVVFEELPDEVTLAINVSNCCNNCVGCHSPYLKKDLGEELTVDTCLDLISKNEGITAICFMGEGNDQIALIELLNRLKLALNGKIKIGIYSGRKMVESPFYDACDYIKVGPYIAEYGPLNKKTTNQRLYEIKDKEINDITYKFWK